MSHGYMKLFIRSFLVCPVFTSSFYKRIFFSEFLILNLKKVYKEGNFMIKNEERKYMRLKITSLYTQKSFCYNKNIKDLLLMEKFYD